MEEQAINNPVQQPNIPTPPAPKHQTFLTSKLFLITLAIVVIFTIVYAGIYLYLGSQLDQISKLSPSPLPSETPVKEVDPTANWKTYTNTRHGYSIKYLPKYFPYGFNSNRSPLPDNQNIENVSYIMFRDEPIPKEYYDALPHALWIAVTNRKEYEEFKQKLEDAVKKAPCAGCPTKSRALINGISADVYDGYGGYTLDKIFLIEYKERFYRLSYDHASDPKYAVYPYDISETMINSFQFTDQENRVICTQDVKQCPDGSYVSRQPPSCEFAACPQK